MTKTTFLPVDLTRLKPQILANLASDAGAEMAAEIARICESDARFARAHRNFQAVQFEIKRRESAS